MVDLGFRKSRTFSRRKGPRLGILRPVINLYLIREGRICVCGSFEIAREREKRGEGERKTEGSKKGRA